MGKCNVFYSEFEIKHMRNYYFTTFANKRKNTARLELKLGTNLENVRTDINQAKKMTDMNRATKAVVKPYTVINFC